MDKPFTSSELDLVQCKATSGKAPGEDGIPNEYLKNANPDFL